MKQLISWKKYTSPLKQKKHTASEPEIDSKSSISHSLRSIAIYESFFVIPRWIASFHARKSSEANNILFFRFCYRENGNQHQFIMIHENILD